MFPVNQQIEGQLGHTLGGGKTREGQIRNEREIKNPSCAPKKGYHKSERVGTQKGGTGENQIVSQRKRDEYQKGGWEVSLKGKIFRLIKDFFSHTKGWTRERDEPSKGQCEAKNGSA